MGLALPSDLHWAHKLDLWMAQESARASALLMAQYSARGSAQCSARARDQTKALTWAPLSGQLTETTLDLEWDHRKEQLWDQYLAWQSERTSAR